MGAPPRIGLCPSRARAHLRHERASTGRLDAEQRAGDLRHGIRNRWSASKGQRQARTRSCGTHLLGIRPDCRASSRCRRGPRRTAAHVCEQGPSESRAASAFRRAEANSHFSVSRQVLQQATWSLYERAGIMGLVRIEVRSTVRPSSGRKCQKGCSFPLDAARLGHWPSDRRRDPSCLVAVIRCAGLRLVSRPSLTTFGRILALTPPLDQCSTEFGRPRAQRYPIAK